MKIKDRAEFAQKPTPLTLSPDTPVATAARAMAKKMYGSVVVTDGDGKLLGIVTERDLMTKIVATRRDPQETRLRDIMTEEVRVARADDDLIDWLRIMSNERFRRLPIVDDSGRVVSMMSQGDFVSYTWPELLGQARIAAQAAVGKNYPLGLVAGSVMLYSLVMAGILVSL
ncbi:MAG: cyclic nucleotide-binding/CBS domain-containing protein [Pikeienuella sp.]